MSGSDIVKLLQQRLYSDGSSSLNSEQERTFEDIISVMKTDGNTSTGVESPYGKISSNFMRNHKFSHDTDDFFIIFYDKNFISLKSHFLMRL